VKLVAEPERGVVGQRREPVRGMVARNRVDARGLPLAKPICPATESAGKVGEDHVPDSGARPSALSGYWWMSRSWSRAAAWPLA
jgi:hypothetical protein